jgi:hypothetical protein
VSITVKPIWPSHILRPDQFGGVNHGEANMAQPHISAGRPRRSSSLHRRRSRKPNPTSLPLPWQIDDGPSPQQPLAPVSWSRTLPLRLASLRHWPASQQLLIFGPKTRPSPVHL